MDIQNVGFLARTARLSSPTPGDLRAAYLNLSSNGSVVVSSGADELAFLLGAAEQAGFHGMRVEASDSFRIVAYKGKEGPCHDTGRWARYRGSAAAALDDDHHLLSGRTRVCEKTARLLGSDPYRDRVEVSGPDPGLLERLTTNPAPFDCDTFEADARSLAAAVPAAPPPEGPSEIVYYPGPFRLLVLADGSIVRRGRLVRLPSGAARNLVRLDGALLPPTGLPGTPAAPENYAALYRLHGPACLLEEAVPGGASAPPRTPQLDALDEVPAGMRRRLEAILRRGDDYFILTGSDPGQKDGCCPSTEVGFANRLVEAGILDAQGASTNSDCPVTLYAFGSEIRLAGGKPAFVRNDALRTAVGERLRGGARFGRKALVRLALLALLLAAAATLGVGILRQLLR